MGLPWYHVHTVVLNDPGRLLAGPHQSLNPARNSSSSESESSESRTIGSVFGFFPAIFSAASLAPGLGLAIRHAEAEACCLLGLSLIGALRRQLPLSSVSPFDWYSSARRSYAFFGTHSDSGFGLTKRRWRRGRRAEDQAIGRPPVNSAPAR
ncbi:hypothetical protein BRADI_4g34956v3 [Brachypodium distachyon]|uniref:Uncharacterized protein n=1 Tax=Brachypodium distachyon TaxID=15368 RepID=A0A0Q3HBZ0_BRADI|nr:hypothetical protein BRADI_4g34956v3 [Brachypodium distachyon]